MSTTAHVKTPGNQLIIVKLEKIKLNEQARKYFDLTELRALGENIREHGLLNPLLVKRAGDIFELVAGERRHRAMTLVGIAECPVIVIGKEMNPADTEVVQWIENAHRSDLLPAEKARGLLRIKEKTGWNNKQLAEHLHFTEASLVGRYLSLFDCVKAVQDAADSGKIGLVWYNLSQLPPDEQEPVLQMTLAGVPRDQIASIVRQKRNGKNGDASTKQKLSRLSWQLPNGVRLVVAGENITFDLVIDALLQSAKSAKAARDQNVAPATWTKMVKDQAKPQNKEPQ
jgi:ParB/RepB/Spo0J family partition protein